MPLRDCNISLLYLFLASQSTLYATDCHRRMCCLIKRRRDGMLRSGGEGELDRKSKRNKEKEKVEESERMNRNNGNALAQFQSESFGV